MAVVKKITVSKEKPIIIYRKIYRKIVNQQPVLRVFYKMSDGRTEEKYFTDPKNLELPKFWTQTYWSDLC